MAPTTQGLARLDEAVAKFDGGRLSETERAKLTIEDRALFIYTSGTTGLPKAANINHYRLMLATHGFAGAMGVQPTDRMYDCLPLYHTNGGVLGTGAVLVGGGTTVIREKFSAREFWDDVVRWNCTMFFYIGELCRYLVTAPPSEAEKRHKIRLCCGNGMRPDVWGPFQARYHIPRILEFYAATEGNVAFFNFGSHPGAVGRLPVVPGAPLPIALVEFDIEKEQPVRGPDGFCVKCENGEIGEVIGQIINDPDKPANRFEGYADKEATEEDPARRVREGRRLVPHRRPDAPGRERLLLFHRPHRRHLPLEGRERRDLGSLRGDHRVPRRRRGERLRRARAGLRRQGRHGRGGRRQQARPEKMRDYLSANLPEYAQPLFLRIKKGSTSPAPSSSASWTW